MALKFEYARHEHDAENVLLMSNAQMIKDCYRQRNPPLGSVRQPGMHGVRLWYNRHFWVTCSFRLAFY